jgi:hypothetical protein
MWKKILVTSLVAIGAVSCAYNRPAERNDDARVERNDAPTAPRVRPMGEGEMETPGIDSAPDPMSPDIPVAPDSGSDEAAPGATTPPSGVPSADPSGGMSDDDILSPADDSDVMTPGQSPTPPDAIAPVPDNDSDTTDGINDSDDDDADGDGKPDANKKKKAPGRGEGEAETDENDDEALPGDAEIDGETN